MHIKDLLHLVCCVTRNDLCLYLTVFVTKAQQYLEKEIYILANLTFI